jgi:hypothetical protein
LHDRLGDPLKIRQSFVDARSQSLLNRALGGSRYSNNSTKRGFLYSQFFERYSNTFPPLGGGSNQDLA